MNQKTEPNDMAFPVGFNHPSGHAEVYQGMTKREYFSIMILQGIFTNSLIAPSLSVTRYAIGMADELIKELNK